MSNYMYRHLPEIMEQRAARLSGLSFLTVWQFLACAGVGAVGTGLKMPIPVVVILVLLAYGALFVWRGEFIFSRLWAIHCFARACAPTGDDQPGPGLGRDAET